MKNTRVGTTRTSQQLTVSVASAALILTIAKMGLSHGQDLPESALQLNTLSDSEVRGDESVKATDPFVTEVDKEAIVPSREGRIRLRSLRQSGLFLEPTQFALLPLMAEGVYEKAFPLLFDASPALHVYVVNYLSELLARRVSKRYVLSNVSFTYMPSARMDLSNSDVNTPSYRARINWQIYRISKTASERQQLSGLRLSLMHYSNGQGGCSFASDGRDVPNDSACRNTYESQSKHTYPRDFNFQESVNRDSGSMSSNTFAIALHHRFVRFDVQHADLDGLHEELVTHTLGLQAEWRFWLGDGIEAVYPRASLRPEYHWEHAYNFGRRVPYRFSVNTALELLFSKRRDGIGGDYRGSHAFSPYRIEGRAALTFPKLNDLGLFIGLVAGQDSYNIRFVDDITWIQWGIILDCYPRPRYSDSTR